MCLIGQQQQDYAFEPVTENLQFPEGPAWDGRNTLYVSNCYGGWITRIQNGRVDTLIGSTASKGCLQQSNGLTVYKDGSIYACDFGRGAILNIEPSGNCRTFLSGFNRPNDLAFDQQGNLYFTDTKSYDADKPDGKVYAYVRAQDTLRVVYDGLAFPNGLAFSADGRFLFVSESARSRIIRFAVQPDGMLALDRVFINLPGGDPDGLAFDQGGNLYVAHFGSGTLFIIDPDGAIKDSIPTPGNKPSNLEFGGQDLKTLYITEDENNAVYKIHSENPGLPLFSAP